MSPHRGVPDAGTGPQTIDPRTLTTQAAFGAALTDLRLTAGLSVRDVAGQTNLPVSTVGGYFSGKHLPPATRPEVLDALLVVLKVPATDRDSWQAAARRLGRARFGASAVTSPYPGLRAYAQGDHGLFRGRAALTTRLLDLVRDTANARAGLVMVTGASGAGKSSLLRAGLIPRLDGWATAVCTPGADPVAGVLGVLDALDPTRPACLVVDQLEEAWTLGADAPQRTELVDHLLRWATSGDQPRVVVAGLRADFYASAAELASLHSALQDRQLLVGQMDDTELAEAIREPAIASGAAIEPGFVDFLVAECHAATSTGQQTVLPHLNHCLATMWAHRQADQLTVADYLAVGGLDGAVTETAEKAWDSLAPDQHAAARRLLLRLVSVDDDLPPAAVEYPLARLGAEAATLIRHFADARLLTVDADSVRLSHEAVIASWPRLQQWLDEDRGLLIQHRMVTREAAAWMASGRDDAFLLRGSRLAAVRDWPADWAASLDAESQQFVDASVNREHEAERAATRRARQLRRVLVGTSIISVLALVASVAYLSANRTLERERDEARSRQLAATARTLGETNFPLGAALSMAAFETADTLEARSALIDLTAAPTTTRLVGPVGQRVTAASPSRNVLAVAGTQRQFELFDTSSGTPVKVSETAAPMNDAPDASIFAMAISPGGTRLALGGTGGRVRLLDITDPAAPRQIGTDLATDGTVYSVAFAGEDTLLAGSQRGGVERWRLDGDGTASPLAPLPVTGATQALAIQSDGVLSAGTDAGQILIWPAAAVVAPAGAAPARTNTVSTVGINGLTADGDRLLVAGRDRLLREFPLTGTALGEPRELGTFKTWVNASAVGADVVVAGSSDSTVRVWRNAADTAGTPLTFPSGVTDVEFTSPTTIAVGLSNGEVHVIDLTRTLTYPGPGIAFTSHLSSGSNRLLVVPSSVNRLSVFELGPSGPARLATIDNPKPDDAFNGTGVMSPDGRLAVVARYSGAVTGFDLSDPDRPRARFDLPVSTAMPEHLAISADGRTLLVGGDDQVVRVVDLSGETPRVTATLEGPTNYILGVAISPDGSMIAAASLDTRVWLWTRDGDRWGTPTSAPTAGHAFTVAFHPDLPVLAGSGVERAVHLWDVSDGDLRKVGTLSGPDNDTYQVAFSPLGSLAAASLDKTVTVWDADTIADAVAAARESGTSRNSDDSGEAESAEPMAVLRASGTGLYSVSWSSDGGTLVAGGSDGIVRAWTVAADRATQAICAARGDGVTAQEWDRIVPDIPFTSPCPSLTR